MKKLLLPGLVLASVMTFTMQAQAADSDCVMSNISFSGYFTEEPVSALFDYSDRTGSQHVNNRSRCQQ